MASLPPQNDVFLREVDDAVRQDQLATALRRYGGVAALAVILALAALGGWLWYANHRDGRAGDAAERYVQALDRIGAGNPAAGRAALAELGSGDNPAYRAAALIAQAQVAADAGDTRTAIARLAAVAGDTDAPQAVRDLALVRQTALEFDALAPAAVVNRLAALATPESPWFGTAGEMTAMAYLRQGQRAKAGALFARIAAHDDVAPTLKSRAVQMAGMLGVDAVASPSPAAAAQ